MANVFMMLNGRREARNRLTLADLSDNEIMQMTRFPRHAMTELCDVIGDDLSCHIARSLALPVEKAVGCPADFCQWQLSMDGRAQLWFITGSSQPLHQQCNRITG